jgi:hypothetical protein
LAPEALIERFVGGESMETAGRAASEMFDRPLMAAERSLNLSLPASMKGSPLNAVGSVRDATLATPTPRIP